MTFDDSVTVLHNVNKILDMDVANTIAMSDDEYEAYLMPGVEMLAFYTSKCINKLLPTRYNIFFEEYQFERPFTVYDDDPPMKGIPYGSIPESFGFEVLPNTLNAGSSVFENAVSNMGTNLFFHECGRFVYRVKATTAARKMFTPSMAFMLHGPVELHLFTLTRDRRVQFVNDSSRDWNTKGKRLATVHNFYINLMKDISDSQTGDESALANEIWCKLTNTGRSNHRLKQTIQAWKNKSA